MAACAFFGHRDCADDIEAALVRVLEELITRHSVTMFYVGHQGRFDQIVLKVLRTMKSVNAFDFDYAVVLAYMPDRKQLYSQYTQGETMLPEGIETVHPKFAIAWRNDWMLDHVDYVVSYTKHPWGGASKYTEKAKRKGKQVIQMEK